MLGDPLCDIRLAPEKPFIPRKSADGRERFRVSAGIAADAGDRFVDFGCEKFNSKEVFHWRHQFDPAWS